jgi:hypothetical protein
VQRVLLSCACGRTDDVLHHIDRSLIRVRVISQMEQLAPRAPGVYHRRKNCEFLFLFRSQALEFCGLERTTLRAGLGQDGSSVVVIPVRLSFCLPISFSKPFCGLERTTLQNARNQAHFSPSSRHIANYLFELKY